MFHTRKWMLAFFMPGFLLGILYVNFFARQAVSGSLAFSSYFLKQYAEMNISSGEFFSYLLRVRLFPFLLLVGFAFTRMRKSACFLVLAWTGFSGAVVLTTAALRMGIKGILLCVVGMFPHFLCYVPAYMVVLMICRQYPQNQWNHQKAVFIGAAMFAGMLSEIYISPVCLKAFIQILV